MIFTLQAAKSI